MALKACCNNFSQLRCRSFAAGTLIGIQWVCLIVEHCHSLSQQHSFPMLQLRREYLSIDAFYGNVKKHLYGVWSTLDSSAYFNQVRTCCEGAEICNKCWKFMTVAVKILDTALREDFGYQHLLWVYSGRRGVHCWVCDAKARALSQSSRSAVAEYLQLIRGGESVSKKVSFAVKVTPIVQKHYLYYLYFLRRAFKIASQYFEDIILEDQDFLSTPELWGKILALIPDTEIREALNRTMPQCVNSRQRWNTIQAEINRQVNKGDSKKTIKPNLVAEIILQLVYPRLDIHVTKGLNHLLKSPFCVHPKTGRVCVCFDPLKADDFNPLDVPHLGQLEKEVSEYDAKHNDTERSAVAEYKKTSMKQSMTVFESFLNRLGGENATRRLEEKDMEKTF
ncbi:DNA primase small subunit-like [Macrobrachium nipponense]|uniref:DNA primase small subunit-like n=1 Tax=Macrobrachium nipponense TaxID=159736 RepID=UPI0030C814AF